MSLSKARLKTYRSLQMKKPRAREGRFLAEGARVVREALASGTPIECVIQAEDAGEEAVSVGEEAAAAGVERVVVDGETFSALSGTRTPQGILAVVPRRAADPAELLAGEEDLLLLDAVQDPGNLGTLLRCARGFGLGGVLLGRGTVDATDPKVVRAAAGAHFALPITGPVDPGPTLAGARRAGFTTVVADARGGEAFDEVAYPDRLVVVLGNEGQGPAPAVTAEADIVVQIPLLDGSDSINVAVASGILLYEIMRRRRQGGP